MRLITWNCCHGNLAPKRAVTRALRPDVLVLQECARDRADSEVYRWFGDDPKKKGVAVVCAEGWRLDPIERAAGVPRWALPVRVRGPSNFLLLAVWTKFDGKFRYIEGLHRALDEYATLLSGEPVVVMGDFNSSVIWDHEHKPHLNHSAMVKRLDDMHLVSAYHEFHSEPFGAESRPTFYFWKREDRPFHIDYCFLPRHWVVQIQDVTVGRYADYRAMSDHCPLIVDIASGS